MHPMRIQRVRIRPTPAASHAADCHQYSAAASRSCYTPATISPPEQQDIILLIIPPVILNERQRRRPRPHNHNPPLLRHTYFFTCTAANFRSSLVPSKHRIESRRSHIVRPTAFTTQSFLPQCIGKNITPARISAVTTAGKRTSPLRRSGS